MINDMNQTPDLEGTAIKALAAASKTPFLTAFKVTMGVALARMAVAFFFCLTVVVFATVIYAITR